jgi:hypothetical protein
MAFFKEVEGEAAIVVSNGTYKQVPLFTRDGYIYAKVGGGFVRLMSDGSTTKAKMRLDFMTWTAGELRRDEVGRLCTDDVPASRALDDKRQSLLLGGPAE